MPNIHRLDTLLLGNPLTYMLARSLASPIYMQPIFIVGGSRSGTSVLLQALGQHPHILGTPGEAPLLTSIGGLVHLIEYGEEPTRGFYNASLRLDKAYLYKLLRRLSFEIACGRPWGFKTLATLLIREPTLFFKKVMWAAKTFPNEKVALGLLHLFPETRFLHIIRNGIEVVASASKFHGFRDRSFEDNCNRWSHSIFTYKYLTRLSSSLTLRHEDLVADPDSTFETICHFLAQPVDKRMPHFVSRTLVHPLDEPTKTGVAVREQFLSRRHPYLQWTHEQQTLFKTLCGEAMGEAGYKIPF